MKGKRRTEKIYPSECRVPKNSKRDKKAFLNEQCKEIEENNRMGKTEISSRKLEIPREHFIQGWHNKEQKQQEPNRSRRDKEVARI